MSKFSFGNKKKTKINPVLQSSRKKTATVGTVDSTLNKDIGSPDIDMDMIRKGFGRGLKALGEVNESIVAVCADLTGSVSMDEFAKAFPARFVEVGIAEQNLVTVSSGLAAMGKIPFCASYAAFAPGRCWEQFKTTACINDMPVKLVGGHAGLYTGPDGATHQMLEDIAIMRALPNCVVIVPCDAKEAEKATVAMSEDKRPNYLRLARDPVPTLTTDSTPFEIGKAQVFRDGSDITIVATGVMTYQAMLAAENLSKDGVSAEVIHVATIKPLDTATILKSAKKTGRVITAEEAQINGGLGSAVAELLVENHPVPMHRIGVKDRFGETGRPDELMRAFGLTHTHIALAAHDLIAI